MRTTPDRRRHARIVPSLAVALLALSGPPWAAAACRADGRYVMGTVLELDLCGEVAPRSYAHAFATAERLDASFTTWADDSDVLRLNRAGGAPTAVPEPVRAILERAIVYARDTGGAFDVSVGPLVRLWRQAGKRRTLPGVDEIERARAHVGIGAAEIRADDRVRLPAGMALDFGGLAKGFALERIASGLRRDGVRSGLLDFGQSSLVALGAPPDAPAWDLWVRRPDGPIVGVVSLRDTAASTSATFGRTVEIAGTRYSHVVDPRTGLPVAQERLAFVVAPDAGLAEAWSTALVVAGPRGLDALERIAGVEGLVVEGREGRLWRTSGFDRVTQFRPTPVSP